ncbi:hypothetical protein [Pseudalkalibacillus salsuginis]|uniref:hypothetical protein n=1 Tax=Pseudalkalibacillus salsuginis TaxID=2910972 RepID=UPI001F21E997|nr:hypothetical protein [Pseudalkalibacillus salsuginis]MCF6410012.1 hypothetical protein [Pseudalkalibacillus salsuginis]
MKFENNYGGYPRAPKGTFKCKFTSLRGGDIYLQMCTSGEGKEVSTMLGLIGSEEAFKKAKQSASKKIIDIFTVDRGMTMLSYRYDKYLGFLLLKLFKFNTSNTHTPVLFWMGVKSIY